MNSLMNLSSWIIVNEDNCYLSYSTQNSLNYYFSSDIREALFVYKEIAEAIKQKLNINDCKIIRVIDKIS